jgi:hypothetical protein
LGTEDVEIDIGKSQDFCGRNGVGFPGGEACDADGLGRSGIEEAVVRECTRENGDVGAITTNDRIVSGAAGDCVVAVVAGDCVVSGVAGEGVVGDVTGQGDAEVTGE